MLFLAIVFIVAILAGATAAVSGFGIGSLLTPLLATRYPMAAAVAAVSVPHVAATVLRCWRLRASISWPVIRSFGVLSAAGGLTGALLYARFSSRVLTIALGALLIATAFAALSDRMRRLHPRGPVAQALGFVSGLFGGLAGNQGGLRAAALLSFGLAPAAFVATATAVGVAVDAARMPVYLSRSHAVMAAMTTPIGVATVGVLIGTLLGERLLFGLSPEKFRRVVAVLIGALGIGLIAS